MANDKWIKQSLDYAQQHFSSNMSIQRKTYSVTGGPYKQEIMKELPEKWCVKRTIANSEILNKWNNFHPLFKKQNRYHASSICDVDWFYSDRQHTDEVLIDYTEISFEDFQTWVLYETPEPQSTIPEDLSYLIPLINKL